MKKKLLFPAFCLLLLQSTYAQESSACGHWAGVFFTSETFLTNTFSDSICMDKKGNAVWVGNNSIVNMDSESGKKKFKLGQLTGYHDGANKYKYFYDEKDEDGYFGYFKIEQSQTLIIYSQWYLHGGDIFFYSKGMEGAIRVLTKKNLQRDFANEDFIKEIKNLGNTERSREAALKVNEMVQKYFEKK